MYTIILSIITFFAGLGLGIFVDYFKNKININKFRMRKYKNKLYSALLESIQEMTNANMTIEDFKDTIYQNTVYKLIIKYNINNIQYMDIYEYLFNYCEKHKNLDIDETIMVKYQKLQENAESEFLSNVESNTNSENMPERFQMPVDTYSIDSTQLTDPFRM